MATAKTTFTAAAELRGADGRTRFRGRLITAGRIRNGLDRPGDIEIPAKALKRAVIRDQFDHLACFIDHANHFNGPSLRNLFGVWSDIRWNEETLSVEGTLNVYETSQTQPIIDLFHQVLAAQETLPDLGVSIVFYGEWVKESTQPRVLSGFVKIESADLVFMPAADGRILEALSALSSHAAHGRHGGKHTMANENEAAQEKTAVAQPATPEFVDAQEALGEAWLGSIRQSGLRRILADSDLPDVVKKRLAKQTFRDPQEVHAAIAEAHEELQALEHEETVELGSRPWIYVKDPQEDIRNHVDWFFGVEGAPIPPSNYRRLDQLYVAMTGDSEFYGVFQPDKVLLASADTSTLAGMAVDAMNKVVMTQFSRLAFWRWYEKSDLPHPQ